MELNPQNIEHSALEADIERLSKEIGEKKNLLEYKKIAAKEIIKQTLQPMIKQQPSKNNQQSNANGQISDVISQILPDYLANIPNEIKLQIEELVDSLFHQGIEKVIKRARRASPFVLDAFHDTLTDKLHEELKKRKLI